MWAVRNTRARLVPATDVGYPFRQTRKAPTSARSAGRDIPRPANGPRRDGECSIRSQRRQPGDTTSLRVATTRCARLATRPSRCWTRLKLRGASTRSSATRFSARIAHEAFGHLSEPVSSMERSDETGDHVLGPTFGGQPPETSLTARLFPGLRAPDYDDEGIAARSQISSARGGSTAALTEDGRQVARE